MSLNIKQYIWKVLIGLGSLLAVISAVWGFEKHFVTRELHSICIEDVHKEHKLWLADVTTAVKQIQIDSRLQRAYDEVYFWQRIIIEMTQACSNNPQDMSLKKKLEGAENNLKNAEERLRELQK